MRDIFFLTCGSIRFPEFALGRSLRDATFRRTSLSCTVGVAVRDSGDVILVDAGWSAAMCARRGLRASLVGAGYGLATRAEDSIAAQLESLGILRTRVITIVATHLHLDHIGGAGDFPNAEIVCTTPEFVAFRKGGFGYRRRDFLRVASIRALRLDDEARFGFPASFDLFDDGEIVLLDAGGHTKGSIAVALAASPGAPKYIHIGDAAYRADEFATNGSPSLYAGWMAFDRASLAKTHARLGDYAARGTSTVLVPSHDSLVFAALPHAPGREVDSVRAAAAMA